ncbi:hypothetical protein OVA29_15155 [Exiguobacterium sp. SL14]|nr:hypothetical protein [Exiguobacterium sp. SL14]MCY1691842.1 hypothetical protein [Exiguobacterium sp. SL14]
MQWLILSKPERERLHPVNVALFFIGMIMIPFVLTHDQTTIVVYHLLLFLFVQERNVFRYLVLPALYAVMMCVPLLYGASIDTVAIYETTIQVTLFVTSSQWIFTLVRLDQMGPLFRFLPRLTRLTGMVLALIPSFLRTWLGSQDESSRCVACCSTRADGGLSYYTDRSGAVSLKTGSET